MGSWSLTRIRRRRLVVEQTHLRQGGGIGLNVARDEALFGQAAQALDIPDDGGHAIFRHLLVKLAGVEPEQFPAPGFEVVVAQIILGNAVRVRMPEAAIGLNIQPALLAIKGNVPTRKSWSGKRPAIGGATGAPAISPRCEPGSDTDDGRAPARDPADD